MITVICLILAKLGVITFSWYILLVESIVLAVGGSIIRSAGSTEAGFIMDIAVNYGCSGLLFSVYKIWGGLELSAWWLIILPVIMLLLVLLPGGFTIMNWILKASGKALPLRWMWIAGIVIDVLTLALSVGIGIAVGSKSKNEPNSIQ